MTMSDTTTSTNQPSDPNSQTGKLCLWVNGLQYEDIPQEIQTRAKYLILDGLACLLVGAQLPWSQKAVKSLLEFEGGSGTSSVFGWEKKTSPLTAALLNSSFIQGLELDDWHSEAPLHSNSILLPALFAASASASASSTTSSTSTTTGKDFLLAYIAGLEVGPRVGNALYGKQILTTGWHSGAVFGPSASSCATSKLFSLPASKIEDALGIACTQACGLMSAQFESDVKRMQHGFAARNGLIAAVLAKGGYVGIKNVLEREYGGFLDMFSKGNGKTPRWMEEEVTRELGTKWMVDGVRVKPYAAMAGTHGSIDCVRKLQDEYADEMKTEKLSEIQEIVFEMGDVAFSHGGWKASQPLTSVGAQMNCAFVAATQMIDREVTPLQFSQSKLERKEVWELVGKTTCVMDEKRGWDQAVQIRFRDGRKIETEILGQRGVDPPLSNGQVVDKWKSLTRGVIDDGRRDEIERLCLGLDGLDDVGRLMELLEGVTGNVLE